MPIPGTGITLDTPEAIDAWIAERKKRWPSTQRVQERARSSSLLHTCTLNPLCRSKNFKRPWLEETC